MKRMQNVLLRSTVLAGFALSSLAVSSPALAQDNQTDDENRERIVVTGSRLRRDEFSAVSPIQVINADEQRQLGISDATALIADSPVVSGVQLDGSVNSGSPTAAVEGVPVNGPGASTVALRGLGPERTLLLVNGRRLGPSGVRGAPVAPDLNLIPTLMIDRIELLTDGASSIYGADAVAGVANIILRDDFDGFEVSAFTTLPENNGGEVFQMGFIGGASTDRSNFTVSAEFYNRTAVIAGDRSHWNDCLRDIDVTDQGDVMSVCMDRRPDNSVFVAGNGFVWSIPGFTNPALAPNGIGTGWGTSADVFAQTGSHFYEQDAYSLQDEEKRTQLMENLERMNIFASGHYDVNFFENDTIYFEMSYSTRNSVGRFTDEQVFPGVPALIPQEDANGNLLVNPDGSLQLFDNPLNPFDADALPVYSLEGLSQRRRSDVDVFRFVGGIEGDLPFLMDRGWVYDITAAYDRSYGTASQPVMREDGIREALDTLRLDVNGNPICGLDRQATSFGFLTPANCPTIDFFSPTLFTVQGGTRNFATQEETDFLFGQAINITEMEQVHAQAIFTGDLFDMPAGTVGMVVGFEFREQRINSINDVTRVLGTAASEIPDTERPTVGRTSLFEGFIETEIPVTDTFNVGISTRFTEEENFGAHMTYSTRASWQLTDSVRLRGTYGTSFRAPNLREQFLAGATGTIGGGNDPCLVPTTANNGGVYDPNGETRSQLVLDNCIAAGADPTALGLLATTGITTSTGGNPNASAETSESMTLSAIFQHSFANDLDLDLSVTYFDIQIENTLEESNAAQIIANCYNNQPNLADPSCSRITRNTGNPATATIALVDASFINVGQLTSTGIDYNVRARMPLSFIDDQTDLTVVFNAAQYLEQLRNEDPTDPNSLEEDLIGRIANPEWLWQLSATATRGNWAARWRTRYQGEGQQENSDALTQTDLTRAVPRTACEQLGYAGQCRDVDFVDSYVTHDLSLSYDADMWSFSAGINNLTDEQPPLIDQGEGPSRMNMVVQSGYDLIGRRAFATVTRRF